MSRSSRKVVTAVSAVVVALGCMAPAYAQDQARKPASQSMPAEQGRAGDGVSYVSGGVGDDSEARIVAAANQYNLKLLFTLNEGNYLSDVNVAITDARGRKVIEDVANGPFFLAKLPAGQYTVTATYEGKTQTRKVSVGKGLHSAHMRWASDPVADFPGPRDGSTGRRG